MIEILHKHITPAEINFTPGERSFVAWISLDVVDNEGDVVVPAGVDYESVYMGVKGDPTRPGNPVVMAIHDYQRWPLGTCEWIRLAKPSKRLNFSGLYSKTLIDDDPDAIKVFGMIQRRVVRGISIGFRPPDDFKNGEWGPPTRDELAARPEWARARRIIRRCVLLEYSVVPIPMNQGALIVAVSKGLELPSFLQRAIDKDTFMHKCVPGLHVKCPKGLGCGVVKEVYTDRPVPGTDEPVGSEHEPVAHVQMHDKGCKATDLHRPFWTKDLAAYDDAGVTDEDTTDGKGLTGSSGPAGGCLDEPAHGDPNETEPPNPDQSGEDAVDPVKKGDRVAFERHKGCHAGIGVVKSIHTSGKVGGCTNHAEASEDEPHARVKCYKSMDHPFHFHESEDHVAVPVTKCKRLDTMRFTDERKGYGAEAVVSRDGSEPFTMHYATKGVAAFKESPRAEGSWDAAAARVRLKARAGDGMERYREGFAWYDSARPDDYGSYKLPIKDVRGGKLVVVKEAVTAALAVVDGGRGGLSIPSSDKAAVKGLLARYLKLWDDSGEHEDDQPGPKSIPAYRTRAQWEADLERAVRARIAAGASDLVQEVTDRLTGAI